jgi:hypothetical protein
MWMDAADRYQFSRLEITRLALMEGDRLWHKPTIPLIQVRRLLNGVTSKAIQQMVDHGNLPAPVDFNPDPVWNTAEFYCCRWRSLSRHEAMISDKRTGNASASYRHDPGNYQYEIRKKILEAAAAKGVRLTHQITIGFKNETGRDDDPAVIRRLNEQEKSEVAALCRKLPRYIMRGFIRTDRGPQKSFYYCIIPENHSRYGNEVRWHFHIELFFRRADVRRFHSHRHRIGHRLKKFFSKYADEREISIEATPADIRFSSYAHKDAENNFDMMVSNLLPSGHK